MTVPLLLRVGDIVATPFFAQPSAVASTRRSRLRPRLAARGAMLQYAISSRTDGDTMEYGIVLPHNEIGTDPGAMKAFAQGAEALGAKHLLIYDHAMGADPNRPGGWKNRPYDKDVAF